MKQQHYITAFLSLLLICGVCLSSPWGKGWGGTGRLPSGNADHDNSSMDQAAPYDTATIGTANLGGLSNTQRWLLFRGNNYRFSQSGAITDVKAYVSETDGLTEFYVDVWRDSASNNIYDLIATSPNIAYSLVAGAITRVDLSTAMNNVAVGDFLGCHYKKSDTDNFLYAKPIPHSLKNTGIMTYQETGYWPDSSWIFFCDTLTRSSNVNWLTTGDSTLFSTSKGVPIECHMSPSNPIVVIGSSVGGGYPYHNTFVMSSRNSLQANKDSLWFAYPAQIEKFTGYPVQNMCSNNAQQFQEMYARYVQDVLNKNPTVVINEGPHNNIYVNCDTSQATEDTLYYMWRQTLTAYQAKSSIQQVIMTECFPVDSAVGGGGRTTMLRRDKYDSTFRAIAAGYSKVTILDPDSVIGKLRTGGTTGNLWNPITLLNNTSDGTHPNYSGHKKLALAIVAKLTSKGSHKKGTFTTKVNSYSIRDTYIYAGDNKNIGGLEMMYTGAAAGVEIRGLTWADLSELPAGCTINTATDSMYMSTPNAGGCGVAVYEVAQDWIPGTYSSGSGTVDSSMVCWTWRGRGVGVGGTTLPDSNNLWTDSLRGTRVDSVAARGSAGWEIFNVTTFVQNVVNGSSNYGLCLKPVVSSTNQEGYKSSDYTSDLTKTPVWTITYTVN